jgi:hypothetical protein
LAGETDAKSVLESIREDQFGSTIDAGLVSAVYETEHEKQFEVDRGSVRASLRDLIEAAVPEDSP